MASAENSSLGEVLQVRTQDSRSGMSGIVDDALESGLESDIHPGPITVTEAVEVEYELLTA